MSAAMKVADLVERAALRLQAAQEAGCVAFGHGTDNAFDEAAWLVLWALGLPLDDWEGAAARAVSPADAARCEALVTQRIDSRQPAAYLTREAWLQGIPFYVDERSIVPRSFIAELITDGSLEPWMHADPLQVLDLCTGNGSLAVLMALAYDHAQVLGADVSEEALAVARINVERHGLQERVRLVQADGLQGLRGSFDLILCNPPYVNERSMADLPAEYRAEPRLALAGGADGMDFIRPLLAGAAAALHPQGALVLEVGNERDHFERAFVGVSGVWLSTSAGDDQVVLLERDTLQAWAHRAS